MSRIAIPEEYQHNPAAYAYVKMSPQIAAAAMGFSLAVYKHALLSLRECEAARARIAQINGCKVCQGFRSADHVAGLLESSGLSAKGCIADRGDPAPDEAFFADIANWRTSPLYSARERIAIELAERFSLAPQSMDNDEPFWSRVHAAYSDAELFDLLLSIGSWVANGRVVHILKFDEVCGFSLAAPQPGAAAAAE